MAKENKDSSTTEWPVWMIQDTQSYREILNHLTFAIFVPRKVEEKIGFLTPFTVQPGNITNTDVNFATKHSSKNATCNSITKFAKLPNFSLQKNRFQSLILRAYLKNFPNAQSYVIFAKRLLKDGITYKCISMFANTCSLSFKANKKQEINRNYSISRN